jgi:uncharacterized protein (DUF736 family)
LEQLIFLDVDVEDAWNRIQCSGKDYFPSLELKEPTIELLQGIFEDFEFNQSSFRELWDFQSLSSTGK